MNEIKKVLCVMLIVGCVGKSYGSGQPQPGEIGAYLANQCGVGGSSYYTTNHQPTDPVVTNPSNIYPSLNNNYVPVSYTGAPVYTHQHQGISTEEYQKNLQQQQIDGDQKFALQIVAKDLEEQKKREEELRLLQLSKSESVAPSSTSVTPAVQTHNGQSSQQDKKETVESPSKESSENKNKKDLIQWLKETAFKSGNSINKNKIAAVLLILSLSAYSGLAQSLLSALQMSFTITCTAAGSALVPFGIMGQIFMGVAPFILIALCLKEARA